MTHDDDDWVGTPPEGRHSREQAKPEHWNRAWPLPTIFGGILGIAVVIVIVLALS